MSAKSYLITVDGNEKIQSAKEKLFSLAPDFVHAIETDSNRIATLEAQNKKLVEALDKTCWAIEHGSFPEDSVGDMFCKSARALLSEVTQ